MRKREAKSKVFFKKAVVLVIAAIFIVSAFIPAVGSQIESAVTSQSSENEQIKIGREEIITSDYRNNPENDGSLAIDTLLWERLASFFNKFLDFIEGNPIIKGLQEFFNTGKDSNLDNIDYVDDEQLTDDYKANDYDKNQLINNNLTNENYIEKLDEHDITQADDPSPMLLSRDVPWWNTDWSYRKNITINHTKVDNTLTNFPVVINLNSDSDLADDLKCQNDGDDIVFTDSSGNKLNHEIEFYNSSNGHLVAWVNVTSLSSSVDTILYMYYGNPVCSSQQNATGVWDSNYKMIHHLKETTGMHYDSTSHGSNGTAYGGMNQDVEGIIDGADEFDGTNDYIDCGSGSSLQVNNFTVSAWIKLDDLYRQPIITEYFDVNNYDFELTTGSGSTLVGIIRSGGSDENTGTYSITAGVYHHVGLTFDGPNLRLYVDGVNVLSNTGMTFSPSNTGTHIKYQFC